MSIIIHKKRMDDLLNHLGDLKNFQIYQPEQKPFFKFEELPQDFFNSLQDLQKKIANFKTNFELKNQMNEENKYVLSGKNIVDIYNQIETEFNKINAKFEEKRDKLLRLKRKLDNLHLLENIFIKFYGLDIDLKFLKSLKLIDTTIGTCFAKCIPNIEKSIKKYNTIFYSERISSHQTFFIIAYNSNITPNIIQILKDYNVIFIKDIHNLKINTIKEIELKIQAYNDEFNKINGSILKLFLNNYYKINSFQEILSNIEQILKIKSIAQFTQEFAYLEGWIPKKNKEKFIQTIHNFTDQKVLIFEDEFNEDKEIPPTLTKFPPIISSFKLLTELYGLPSYNEIDPTIIMVITFPIIFGFMFGDVGHGLSLIIGGIFAYFFLKLKPSYKNLAIIISINGIGSLICGFLYGEFFGEEITPLLFNPFLDPIKAIKLSIILGLIIICLGLIISGINHAIKKETINIFVQTIPKLILFISVVFIIFIYGLHIDSLLKSPLYIPIAAIITIGIGKIVIKIIAPNKYKNEKLNEIAFDSIIDVSETLISIISNLVSFTRIFAMTTIHVSFMKLIMEISNMIITANSMLAILGYIILVAGNILVILFELLMVLMQDLRLHYYEWFSKFYKGEGRKFTPFSLKKKFGIIKLEENYDPFKK
ncbi:MAG: V-type ATP synthase subunit I [Candidatus Helarchaeota archaeon]